jgi:ribonuclease J
MYGLVKPGLVVPCHGETAHLFANEALAKECGVPAVAQAPNGTVLRIRQNEATFAGKVRTGRRAVDGKRIVAIGGEALRGRQQVLHNGAVMISAALDRMGDLAADMEITTHGLTDGEDEELLDDIAELVEDTLGSAPGRDHEGQVEKVRRAVRNLCRARFDKRPVVTVHLLRVDTTLVD